LAKRRPPPSVGLAVASSPGGGGGICMDPPRCRAKERPRGGLVLLPSRNDSAGCGGGGGRGRKGLAKVGSPPPRGRGGRMADGPPVWEEEGGHSSHARPHPFLLVPGSPPPQGGIPVSFRILGRASHVGGLRCDSVEGVTRSWVGWWGIPGVRAAAGAAPWRGS